MAPKQKNARDELKQEDILQAVLLADSFNYRFSPITEEVPRVLLPLVNIPLIEYSLEFLAAAGIEEIFVFCSSHFNQIDEYLRDAGWYKKSSLIVTVVILKGCYSLGDAMRDIDNRALIRNDFVLLFGDTVANLKLTDIVQIHKKTREANKLAVMTLIMKTAKPGHPARSPDDDFVISVDSSTQRVRHYQKVNNTTTISTTAISKKRPKVSNIHYNLLDCQIAVCSQFVPQMFTDDFDYQTRDDLIKGILVNEEITGNSIHIHIAEESYAVRVSNLHMYDTVSRDILQRWCYPLVPDILIPAKNKDNFVSYGRYNTYQCSAVTLERGCKLIQNVLVGKGTTIESGSVITDSVIGNNCKIGKNVQINGAYLWDNIIVGDNCLINSSILCSGVVLLNNVIVKEGSILSWNVKVGDLKSIIIGPSIRLMSRPLSSDFDDDDVQNEEMLKSDPVYGSESKAFKYEDDEEENDSDEEEEKLTHDIWGTKIPNLCKDIDNCSSVNSLSDDDMSDFDEPPLDDFKMFYTELRDTLLRAEEENIRPDNLILEINSLKHSYNIAIKELNQAVMRLTIEMPLTSLSNASTNQILAAIKINLTKWLPLIKNYNRSIESQTDSLEALMESAVENSQIAYIFPNILSILYDKDVLDEAAIIQWHKKEPALDQVNQRNIWKRAEKYINWLEQAEEEDSE
ncbi:translation initiation factor eIF-2B subunit epsilon [Octopus bimaculoides]|uniref:translation initiation factor eIF-2B subunit epsilon n=1 Tax=Octopus bimaculoides TaxID=37653 RepID=UPI0022E6DF8D|nr:translation initiation factor eIF-2B subunit epsilon [Octopus bimaculoides]